MPSFAPARISVGLVVYRTPVDALLPLFDLLVATPQVGPVLVFDNGNDAGLRLAVERRGWRYLSEGRNIGFGSGHNRLVAALGESGCEFHLLVNPDIEWHQNPFPALLAFLDAQPRVAAVMPDVINAAGQRQYLAKAQPTPGLLLGRRFLPRRWLQAAVARYELQDWDFAAPRCVPVISGCFMLLRGTAFADVGGFDERYFLYLEDYDLCRRLQAQSNEVAIVPAARVIHGHQRASYRWGWPLIWHLRSAIRYFWGW
ncbi:glycosyltransferase family 2 protein [Jeongeupia chitinilytica]|uniref:Glycosyl transferase family 2 n=1 Tax=Jeongeupia chitinilytica TaxID=1041641 RepID=A0ABQ3H2T9_9NEIS|nr:glycosyltransferase family 2 protein [Jeongeupia chitinilytica]GHD67469.1 glycosyl transferase family 2 [Jeongeupia chitinilytica]